MYKSYAKIFLAIFFLASLYQIAPFPLKYVDIYLVALFRYIFASIILLGVHYHYTKTLFPKLNFKQWMYIITIGFFGVFLYNITFLWAEKIISGNTVAIIYSFSPCIITIFSSYIFKMKVNSQAKLGIAVALLGTIGIVMFAGAGDESCSTEISIHLGEVLSLLAVVFFSAYAVLGKCAVNEKIHMITITTYSCIVGVVLFAITSISNRSATDLI